MKVIEEHDEENHACDGCKFAEDLIEVIQKYAPTFGEMEVFGNILMNVALNSFKLFDSTEDCEEFLNNMMAEAKKIFLENEREEK